MSFLALEHARQHATGANIHRVANLVMSYQLASEVLEHAKTLERLREASAAVDRIERELWRVN